MARITLTESKLKQIVAESVKHILNELDSGVYDRAAIKAHNLDRTWQRGKFENAANEKRIKELCPFDEDVSSHVCLTREYCKVDDGGRTLSVLTNGKIILGGECGEDWPLRIGAKLCSKISKQLARVIANWCNVYLTPEGKQKLQGSGDWHNWVRL